MRKNVEFEVQRLTAKIIAQKEQIDQIQAKAEKLLAQAHQAEEALKKSVLQMQQIGQKEPRRDGKTESPEEVQNRSNYNEELLRAKLTLVRDICNKHNPQIWSTIEKLVPSVYKDENLPL